jgi:phospholipase C
MAAIYGCDGHGTAGTATLRAMRRRTFLQGAAAGLGLTALGSPAQADLLNIALPSLGLETRPSKTPVEHLVVVMQENRSVDHLLGWYGAEHPDFDARQDASFRDLRQGPDGPLVATASWGEAGRRNYHGRGFEDPSHGWDGGRAERNGGTADGWLHPRTGNDEYALSYYDPEDLPVWAQLTRDYQAYDRWHCSVLGPTFPNRYYLHSGQAGGQKDNTLPPLVPSRPEWALGFDWATVWTLFETYGVTCGYYFNNLPVLALWGARHATHARPMAAFYADAALGQLPQVSFVDPWFTVPEGLANDDHPHADLRLGQAFISDVVGAFVMSPHYERGALVLTYDEWGGFWDHVPPPRVADDRATPADPGGADDFGQLGFRIPSTIVSPWTKGNAVDHTRYEHTSVVKFMCDNWNLPQLTARARGANSIETAFRGFATYDPEPAFIPYEAPLHLLTEPTVESTEDQLGLSAPTPTPAPVAPAATDLFALAELGFLDGLGFDLDQRFADSYARPRPELLDEVTTSFGLR